MKVFISHSSSYKAEALADKVMNSLEEAGLEVLSDRRILAGTGWDRIRQTLRSQSDAMVVLLTPDDLDSEFVREDIEYALGERRFKSRLIPVLVGDSEAFASDRIPWILKRLKTITLPSDSKNQERFEQIAQVLKDAA